MLLKRLYRLQPVIRLISNEINFYGVNIISISRTYRNIQLKKYFSTMSQSLFEDQRRFESLREICGKETYLQLDLCYL